jgi:hypothetical protein
MVVYSILDHTKPHVPGVKNKEAIERMLVDVRAGF